MLWVNIAGMGVIALIIWWFWLYKSSSVEMSDGVIEVLVKDGAYQPAVIKLPANQASMITFFRTDSSPCSESLHIPDLGVAATLRLNKKVDISLPAMQPGRHAFHCQMKMYTGELIVE
ncbi:cupredoxin domain-containing protein [Glaciecola sp. MF2-115]|jgi:plastocyanin domain-containing protein|uniref:cupredoxin domain-containing protein n=1 Tax=Glaciecola sp. MF2-115 TaxID=3384827 RepID=UPI0039A0433F